MAPASPAAPGVDAAAAQAHADSAVALLRSLESVLVAVSGGVDSALVLALARQALGDRAVGAFGVSATYPREELAAAHTVADHVGAHLVEVRTAQLDDEGFLRNDGSRCYRCRDDLFTALAPVARAHGLVAIADGTNADDLGDIRPGLRATREHGVRSPLADVGMTKAEVRLVARRLGLPVWDKPQQACLSSRIPRGTPITLVALRRVEEAERWLRAQGIRQVRVREDGDVARIEVEGPDIERLAAEPLRTACVERLRDLGYAAVALDLEGFVSGKLHRLGSGAQTITRPA